MAYNKSSIWHKRNINMTIKEFIQEFKALGYNDDTDLVIGAYDTNGDWYSFDFEIEDEDRQLNSSDNNIAITLEPSEDYINSRLHSRYDVDILMDRIVSSIYYILNNDA